MLFNKSSQAIYLQIVDYVCEKILLEEWRPEEKIPSIRELAVQLEVNPNTIARTYDFLKQLDIIYDKRGIGYFISPDALKNTTDYLRQEFTKKELPNIFRIMYLLDVQIEDLKTRFETFKQEYSSSK